MSGSLMARMSSAMDLQQAVLARPAMNMLSPAQRVAAMSAAAADPAALFGPATRQPTGILHGCIHGCVTPYHVISRIYRIVRASTYHVLYHAHIMVYHWYTKLAEMLVDCRWSHGPIGGGGTRCAPRENGVGTSRAEATPRADHRAVSDRVFERRGDRNGSRTHQIRA